MATSINTLPQARIPLANVVVNGENYPVEISIEWMRALQGLLDRLGGTSSVNIIDALQGLSIGPLAGAANQVADSPASPVFDPPQVIESADARIQSLEAEVTLLRSRINDFAQSYQI